MQKNILVVDSSLLNSRTIAMLYEVYQCEVTLASSVEEAAIAVAELPIDAVVLGQGFSRQYGVRLRAALKAVQPGLCIAVLGEPDGLFSGESGGADVYLRTSHFYTDLCEYMDTSAG